MIKCQNCSKETKNAKFCSRVCSNIVTAELKISARPLTPKSKPACRVDGCDKPASRIGLCSAHYERHKRHGDPTAGRSTFEQHVSFLEKAMLYTGDECLIWPFGRISSGYGIRGAAKERLVHRYVCERIRGPAPPDKPMALHSCGNGHLACVNPKHLRWGDGFDNAADARMHRIQGKMSHDRTLPKCT